MANDDAPAGFLSRWSRRKVEVREGRLSDEPAPAPVPASSPVLVASAQATPAVAARAWPPASDAPAQGSTPTPTPTLADTEQLTPESDFTGFMARGVTPDVKNAAMKKLFADPHFNVMDRMDIYIDDYSQADPLPLAMLRQMTSAQTLNLFDDTADAAATKTDMHAGDNPQSAPTDINPNLEPHTHDHADLRLQPDPTPRPEGTGSEPV